MSFDVDVTRHFADIEVGARFTAGEGLTVLFGPSGAGKTSVLNMIAGLLRPDRGHVRVNGTTLFDGAGGTDLPPNRRRIGYVFQDGRLFPHKRVRANLLYGFQHTLQEGTMDRLRRSGRLPRHRPSARSSSGVAVGGARRKGSRSAGRCWRGPRTLLMDEPLSSLDAARREEIMGVIERGPRRSEDPDSLRHARSGGGGAAGDAAGWNWRCPQQRSELAQRCAVGRSGERRLQRPIGRQHPPPGVRSAAPRAPCRRGSGLDQSLGPAAVHCIDSSQVRR